ncbi:MAG: substrate-binding domain-containing protein [Rhodothermaceae bacterium]|nr:substrate-binding domain-containing protein [Rhodothermaceae bacterium]
MIPFRSSLLLCLLLVFFLASCTDNQPSDEADALQIAVIPKGTSHQFWKSIHAGANKAGSELGAEIIWQGPQKEDDRQMQIQVVQNFISRNVDAIVLAPLDARSLVKPVESAIGRGIPVVIIDSGLESDQISSFVATDNRLGGALAADHLSELLGGEGKIIVLRYQEGSASTTNREEGFLERIREIAPGIEIVVDNQYAGATIEKAFQVSQNLLNRFGDVDGIFCPNESSVQGMLRALQTAGKAGEIQLVGFDASESLIEGMRDGHIQGLVLQDPFFMAYQGVQTAVKVIKGETVEAQQNTRVKLVTPENIDSAESQELLSPDLETWLK